MYKRLHEQFDLKVQLNLFYRNEDFDLSKMTDAYYQEFADNSDWLKFSFHSDFENVRPYEFSGYEEVFEDCKRVDEQIVRFASQKALAKTTTLHYCLATPDGLRALNDNNVLGLLGLFGDEENPKTSYGLNEIESCKIRNGDIVKSGSQYFGPIDVVLNCYTIEEIIAHLNNLIQRDNIQVMIHEQYFYSDYINYQPDFEEKLTATFSFLIEQGYKSVFFEQLI